MDVPPNWMRFAVNLKKVPATLFLAAHSMRLPVRKGVCCSVHSHRDLEIVYHSTGTGVTRLGGVEELRFDSGSVVIYAPGQRHDQVMDGNGLDVCLQLEMPNKIGPHLTGYLYVPPPIDPIVIAELDALTCDKIWPPPDERVVINLRATTVLLSLLEVASGEARRASLARTQRYVMEAESYLNTHFQTIGSLGEVARHVDLSHDRLRHLFKEHRGTSIIRRLVEIRLGRARSLLIHSDLSIKQVATLSGFRDEYYFSAVFRRFHRLSPTGFRQGNPTQSSGAKGTGVTKAVGDK
jgi:AraC-like DNA-binding protein